MHKRLWEMKELSVVSHEPCLQFFCEYIARPLKYRMWGILFLTIEIFVLFQIATSMVLGTFLSAPILYTSAKMISTKFTPQVHTHYHNTIKETIQDSCVVSIPFGVSMDLQCNNLLCHDCIIMQSF